MTKFFSGDWPLMEQKAFIVQEHVGYLYLGAAEKAASARIDSAIGEIVYDQNGVQILKVKP